MKRLLLISGTALAMFAQVTPTTFLKSVTTAGTAVRLIANDTLVKSATIQALGSNTGRVCFGDSAVLASTYRGTCLDAKQAAPLEPIGQPSAQPFNLNGFWVDSAVNGEGVAVTYYAAN